MKKIIILLLVLLPSVSFAQALRDINSVAQKATNIGDLIIKLTISLAIIWIIVSVVRYLILGAADEEARKKGGQSILFGVIGLFVILSIWGLVSLLTNSFRFVNNSRPSFDNVRLDGGTLPGPRGVDGGTLVPGVNGDYTTP
jgi:Kef-type K+ transport system membrane component KefB